MVGNPNTGKSTLFTALAGVRQRVGNYPGVTVEKKTGHLRHDGQTFELIDLPGTYSLAPRSPDEMVTVDVLLGRGAGGPPPDVVLSIVDASNLERNLFLVSQVLSLGAADGGGAEHDRPGGAIGGSRSTCAGLAERLGVPVVPMQANRREGLDGVEGGAGRGGRQRSSGSTARTRCRTSFSGTPVRSGRRSTRRVTTPLPQFSRRTAAAWTATATWRSELLNGDAAAAHGEAACRPARRWPRRACRCRPSRRWPATIGSPARSKASSAGPTSTSGR